MMSGKMNEFGGYIELEAFTGEEFYPELHKLNLARTSLVWLLDNIDHERVFLPEFLCDTVRESAENAGYRVINYRLNEDLEPVWGPEGKPGKDDIFYLVNYYGQFDEDGIEKYRDEFDKVIVDNAHAFYSKPVNGVHTIYSLRKFFGVPDGAYVASDIRASSEDLPADSSRERANALIGRLEECAGEYYAEVKAAEEAFRSEPPKRMSLFTQNIIRGIDYEAVRRKRVANYTALHEMLGGDGPFTRSVPVCPYAYPYHHKDAMDLRKYLVKHRIYIPVLWAQLIDDEHRGSLEYEWSADYLVLPIDQRYDENDMRFMADLIHSY